MNTNAPANTPAKNVSLLMPAHLSASDRTYRDEVWLADIEQPDDADKYPMPHLLSLGRLQLSPLPLPDQNKDSKHYHLRLCQQQKRGQMLKLWLKSS